MTSWIVIFLGAGLGGVMRHGLNTIVTRLLGAGFPFGVLTINIAGSTAMGILAGYWALRGSTPLAMRLLLTTGVLGGFTTFSTFSLDAVLLYERGQPWSAAAYVLASVGLSIAGLAAGIWSVRTMLA
jgi:CrcB protein